MSYSRRAISSVVSLMATTRPDRFAKRTRWRESPLGRKTMMLFGHSASVVDQGSVSRPGSTELAVMLSASAICLPGRTANREPRRGGSMTLRAAVLVLRRPR